MGLLKVSFTVCLYVFFSKKIYKSIIKKDLYSSNSVCKRVPYHNKLYGDVNSKYYYYPLKMAAIKLIIKIIYLKLYKYPRDCTFFTNLKNTSAIKKKKYLIHQIIYKWAEIFKPKIKTVIHSPFLIF